MAISINPIFPVIAAQSVSADIALQPGTVIDAQVQKVLANDLVRIAIANLSIDVLSEIPLHAGQSLQLAVSQTADGLRLSVVGPDGAPAQTLAGSAAPQDTVTLTSDAAAVTSVKSEAAVSSRPTLTTLEALAVSAAAQAAATRQGSLSPLFANLLATAGTIGLPPAVQQAAASLFALRPNLDPDLAGGNIKTAFQRSGLFFEASMAAGAEAMPASTTGGFPDLKAALIVLRQTLSTWAGDAARAPPASSGAPQAASSTATMQVPSLAPDFDMQEILLPQAVVPVAEDIGRGVAANETILAPPLPAGLRAVATGAALNLLQEALQNGMSEAGASKSGVDGGLASSRAGATGSDAAVVRTSIPPPPFRGALPSAQPVTEAFMSSRAPADVARHLLDDTDAALARQTLLQVASLPDQSDPAGSRLDLAAPRWNFEIPFAAPFGTAVAQFEISRDGASSEADAAKRVWRARFSLDVEPTGPVHALISLTGDKTSVRIWAERPATFQQLRAGTAQLSQALSRADLLPGDIIIREGTPPQPASAPAGHFLDRAS
ncbi:MAG TPA: flagellar hook-length control protein FliK [Nitrobacter sp.]|nr:flagellar hook-length control protein FliK [Nitrobacter sp.]